MEFETHNFLIRIERAEALGGLTDSQEELLDDLHKYFAAKSASPSEADEISNIKACNESLAKLIDQVWEALEPTGEYEGDMNLVEFAKSVRIAKESAEWSRDGLLFKAASPSEPSPSPLPTGEKK